jgi:hypothetical protein
MRMLSAGQPILGQKRALAHRPVSGILNGPIDRQLLGRMEAFATFLHTDVRPERARTGTALR